MKNALADCKVIDLTHYIAGPYCTKLMVGFGAEVIKIEPPETGDKLRGLGPFCKDKDEAEQSIPFLWLNTGKKGITLNLKTVKGVEIFKELVRDADVVIENFSPGVMQNLGLSYEILQEVNPRIVMTSISNFGQTGPYKDYKAEEIALQALCGGMYMTGNPEKAPLVPGPAICQYSAGQHAYLATLMALFQREMSGEGQFVDVSIHECGLENIELTLTRNLQTGTKAKRGPHLFVPWDLYECEDGYAAIIAMPSRHWHNARELFQDVRLFDAKYDHVRDRGEHREEYEAILKPCVKTHKKEELFHAAQALKLAFGYSAGLGEALESPQLREREFFVEIDHPTIGKHKGCGAPFKMSRTPWQSSRAPFLGEHNGVVYGETLGYAPQELQHLLEEGVV